ncbi:MAG TPA: hypothetical protein VN915_17540, partial [Elusimicrobiota bacterium]|nr:hypothetical protein [Elusimicrobiota bacterium]
MNRRLSSLAAATIAPLSLLLAPAARAYDSIHFQQPIKAAEKSKLVAAASSGDRLYVLDARTSTLSIYENDKLLKTAGSEGNKPGQLSEPGGVDVGPTGKVYVA